MSFEVSIDGTGHVFRCQEGESLLDEGLRAGLPLDYGCTAGSCGDCKARLVSGRLKSLSRTDYVFPEADKHQGWFLPCAHTADSDIVLQFPEMLLDGEIPEQQLETRLSKIECAGDDVRVLHLKTARTASLRFFAGQSIEVVFPGGEARRFSVASCPCNGRVIQIHQCRIAGDSVSEAVFERARVGDSVKLSGPYGNFRYDETARDIPQLFIAFGTGFAAIRSLIEHALGAEVEVTMHLVWFGFGEEGHYLDNVCRAWRDVFDNFSFDAISLRQEDSPHCRLGFDIEPAVFRQNLQALSKQWSDLESGRVYASGPKELVDVVNELFADLKPIAHLL